MYQQILRLRQSWRIASAPTAARRARRLLGWRLKRDCEIDLMPCASALLELSLCACARAAPTNSIKRCYGIWHPWPKFRPVTISGIFRLNLGEVPPFVRQGNGSAMPRGGAVTLSDVREPALVIVCEPCERRGRYKVERLMAEHEDAMLTDLLTIPADCPNARSMSVRDRQALAVRRLHLQIPRLLRQRKRPNQYVTNGLQKARWAGG
jgi:hypothetical protein